VANNNINRSLEWIPVFTWKNGRAYIRCFGPAMQIDIRCTTLNEIFY